MTKKHFLVALMLSPLFLAGCKGGGSDPVTTDEPLSITCTEGEGATIQYKCTKTGESKISLPKFEWSKDKTNWTKVDEVKTGETQTIESLNKGETIYFRGDNPNGFNYYDSSANSVNFKFVASNDAQYTKNFKISGNIMSLLSAKDYAKNTTIPCKGCFSGLFAGFGKSPTGGTPHGVVDASELSLPATTLNEYAYYSMFGDANNTTSVLAKAPKKLPAINAVNGCYDSMFYNNKFMVTVPEISLGALADNACKSMLENCAKITIIKTQGAEKFFTCPDTASFADPVTDMFKGTNRWSGNVEKGASYTYSVE